MAMINIDHFDLIIFGDFSVLTNTPWKDHTPLAMLPGRAEYLAWVQEDRHQRDLPPLHFAVAGNKGGVAWNKQTEDQAKEELRWTAEQIGTAHYAVCFACPTCAPGNERYTTPEMLARRKPEPAMFKELADRLEVPAHRVLIVDHYTDGCKAAKELGMTWLSPATFFLRAEEYITTATSPLPAEDRAPGGDDYDPFLDELEEEEA